ncbi:MAG: lipoate--protein ligase family protein [Thermoprotei archaeon]|nr:MAG: lipoate--protein ligase family protein [Thermoprotei archaeon]
MVWRLIIGEGSIYWNMAIDEAMLVLHDKGLIPNTLRIYVMKPSGVTFGYFQRVDDAINLEFLRSKNIDYTRRITGGGAVYHDMNGEITYSIVAKIDNISRDILESYKIICQGIVYAIEEFGLKAEYKPINDVLVNGKKISGSAQARKKQSLLQHGTLMYNTDLDILSNVIKIPKEKMQAHGIRSIRDRVTTLSIELGYNPGYKHIVQSLISGFRKALSIEFKHQELTPMEITYAKKLVNKYRSKEWIFKR